MSDDEQKARGVLAGTFGAALALALLFSSGAYADAMRTGGGITRALADSLYCALTGGTGCAIAFTATADGGVVQSGVRVSWTTPVDTTGTNDHRGIRISPTIGNASGGTNTAYAIGIDAISGDAQVPLRGLHIGNLTGTGASEVAIEIGTGWDGGLRHSGTCSAVSVGSGNATGFGTDGTNVDICRGGLQVFRSTATNTTLDAISGAVIHGDHTGHTDSAMGVVTGGTCTSETVSGTDTRGALTATCSAGQTIIATFGVAFASAPICIISAADEDASTAGNAVTASDTTTFTITSFVGDASAQVINYWCVQ